MIITQLLIINFLLFKTFSHNISIILIILQNHLWFLKLTKLTYFTFKALNYLLTHSFIAEVFVFIKFGSIFFNAFTISIGYGNNFDFKFSKSILNIPMSSVYEIPSSIIYSYNAKILNELLYESTGYDNLISINKSKFNLEFS